MAHNTNQAELSEKERTKKAEDALIYLAEMERIKGKEKKTNEVVSAIVFLLICVFIWLITPSCSDHNPAKTSAKQENFIAAENIVTFKKDSFACFDKKDMEKVKDSYARGEKTKVANMFIDATCFFLSTKQKFKVLSVDREFSGGYLELEALPVKSTDSFWTDESFAIR